MGEKNVLGIATVDEIKRVYFPKSVLDILKVKIGDKIVFVLGSRIFIERSSAVSPNPNTVRRIGAKQRVYVPPSVLRRLKLGVGSDVIFWRVDGKVTMSRG